LATLREATAEFQRTFVLKALQESRGCVTRAAKALGENRTAFYRTMRRLGVTPPRWPAGSIANASLGQWLSGHG